jgi:hypothetical protein
MRTVRLTLIALALSWGLAGPAHATCTTQTYFLGSKTLVCTVCCFGNHCTTTCF